MRVLAIPTSRALKKQVRFLTEEELDALLKASNIKIWVGRRDYTMILVSVETGLRLTELLSLQWTDIYMTGNRVSLKSNNFPAFLNNVVYKKLSEENLHPPNFNDFPLKRLRFMRDFFFPALAGISIKYNQMPFSS